METITQLRLKNKKNNRSKKTQNTATTGIVRAESSGA